MNENLKLHQNQTLQQTLAPLQVQYVKMLEMNAAAIEDEVRRRVDENPALDESESAPAHEWESAPAHENPTGDDSGDYDREDDVADRYMPNRQSADTADRRLIMESNADVPTLSESLTRQLDELDLPAPVSMMARYIIGNLDDNGRLTRTPQALADDISMHTGTDLTVDDLRPALDAVRSLDPAGVGAVDLRDCLLLQLDRRQPGQAVDDARRIIADCFDIFATKNLTRLRRCTGLSADRLEAASALIRTLNPKPGNSEGTNPADRALHITPDFYVEPDEGHPGRFVISLAERIPGLSVSESYSPEAEQSVGTAKGADNARAFIRSRRQEATEFIDLLRRRNDTLMAVMRAIVKVQRQFFETEDPSLIRPMILKDISAMTDRDMSVVSRATSGKYVATPGGVYPLKMFFNERPTDDADVSQHAIQQTMRAIIDAEDKQRPLSDEAIQTALAARGMDIARRTVVKYREQMQIPNSRARRHI